MPRKSSKKNLPPFAAKLKALRTAAGLTQQQLADKTGMHIMAISRLETGRRGPAWETVQKLADALGVSCEEFRRDD